MPIEIAHQLFDVFLCRSNWFKELLSTSKTNNMTEVFMSEGATRRCSLKKVFLSISQNSQESTWARVSFLIKACNSIKKETLARVFSCEFCEISKNTFSYGTPPVAASVMFSWWWQNTIIIYYYSSLLLRSFRICFSISFEDVSLLPSMLETSLVLSFTFMEWRLPERKSLVNYKKKLNPRTKIETKKIKQKDLGLFVNSSKKIRMMMLNQNYDVPFA